MFELQGSQTNAIVYTDNVDQKTIGQIITMLNESLFNEFDVSIKVVNQQFEKYTIRIDYRFNLNYNYLIC